MSLPHARRLNLGDRVNRDASLHIRPNRQGSGTILSGRYDFLGHHLIADDTWNIHAYDVIFELNILRNMVKECLEVWNYQVVRRGEIIDNDRLIEGDEASPFRVHSDVTKLSGDINKPHLGGDINQIGLELAIAGWKLFRWIFLKEGYEPGREPLHRIGQKLCQLSAKRSLTITIASDDVIVPWRMLYTHPNGSCDYREPTRENFRWEGFWGLRHRIEHDIESLRTAGSTREMAGPKILTEEGKVNLVACLDNTMGGDYERHLVNSHGRFLGELNQYEAFKVQLDFWTKKSKIKDDFEKQDFPYSIAYFLTHHRVQDGIGSLSINDREVFNHVDLETWMMSILRSPALFFFNACGSAGLSTHAAGSIAKVLLQKGAAAVIGSEIDLPLVFADAYARRFFIKLFRTPCPQLCPIADKLRVGSLIRNLTWEFLYEKKNPLGLAYSVYRGLDAYIGS